MAKTLAFLDEEKLYEVVRSFTVLNKVTRVTKKKKRKLLECFIAIDNLFHKVSLAISTCHCPTTNKDVKCAGQISQFTIFWKINVL